MVTNNRFLRLKKIFTFNSLKKKIITGFICVIIMNLIVFLGVELSNGYKQVKSEALDKSYAYAEHIEKVISPIGINQSDKIQEKITDLLNNQYKLAGAIGVLDKDLKYIANTDESKIGTSFKNQNTENLIKDNKVASFEFEIDGQNEYFSVVPLYKQEKTIPVDVVSSATNTADTITSASTQVNIPGLIVVEMDNEAMLTGLKERLINTTIISFIVFIISIGIAVLISSSITRPLFKIRNHLNQIASGNLTNEVNIKSKDEMLDLAKDINGTNSALKNMISQIKVVSNDLDQYSKELSISAQEVSTVSEEISNSIGEITENSTVQSNNLTDATNRLKEFSYNLDEVNNKINAIESSSKDIKISADKGTNRINEVIITIDEVQDTFKTFGDKIEELTSNVVHIDSISHTINNVAKQTNLLSLNASIEASRAKEAGNGFAVVANEIKSLATQTLESSENITKLIGEISESTKSVSEAAEATTEKFKAQSQTISETIALFNNIVRQMNIIIPEIKEISTVVKSSVHMKDSILNNIQCVTLAAEGLSASMEEISQSIEEQSATIIDMSNLSENLHGISNNMVNVIENFTV